jgi:hypothetical protein
MNAAPGALTINDFESRAFVDYFLSLTVIRAHLTNMPFWVSLITTVPAYAFFKVADTGLKKILRKRRPTQRSRYS